LQQNAGTKQVAEPVTDAEPTSSITDAAASVPQAVSAAVNEEEVDIDLGDPDVQKAAVLIQSGFKQRKISRGLAKVYYVHIVYMYRSNVLSFGLRSVANRYVGCCCYRFSKMPKALLIRNRS